MKQVLITCPTCKGEGKAPLFRALAETLAVLHPKALLSTPEVASLVGDPYLTSPTAITNRLAALKTLNLVVSEKRGKTLFWRRK